MTIPKAKRIYKLLRMGLCPLAIAALMTVSAPSYAQEADTPETESIPNTLSAKDIADLEAQAKAGDADAQFNLGLMYDNGQGVPQNYADAFAWYKKAAEQGYAKAQVNLGVMYANGEGVNNSIMRAYMWFNLAAAQRDAGAIKNRDMAASKLTKDQLAQAQKMAAQCLAQNYKGC